MSKEKFNVFAVIRERFWHIAQVAGPQFASIVEYQSKQGRLAVSELNQWVWAPSDETGPAIILSDKDVESMVLPLTVCRNLLLTSQDSVISMIHQLDVIRDQTYRQNERPVGDENIDDAVIKRLFALQNALCAATGGRVM